MPTLTRHQHQCLDRQTVSGEEQFGGRWGWGESSCSALSSPVLATNCPPPPVLCEEQHQHPVRRHGSKVEQLRHRHELCHHQQHQGRPLDGGDVQAGEQITCDREEGLGEEGRQQHREGRGEVRHHHLRDQGDLPVGAAGRCGRSRGPPLAVADGPAVEPGPPLATADNAAADMQRDRSSSVGLAGRKPAQKLRLYEEENNKKISEAGRHDRKTEGHARIKEGSKKTATQTLMSNFASISEISNLNYLAAGTETDARRTAQEGHLLGVLCASSSAEGLVEAAVSPSSKVLSKPSAPVRRQLIPPSHNIGTLCATDAQHCRASQLTGSEDDSRTMACASGQREGGNSGESDDSCGI